MHGRAHPRRMRPGSREIQARGRRSARGSLSKIANPTATRCSLPSMLTVTFMTYCIRPSIQASRGVHEGSRVYEAYNSKHVLVLTRLSQRASSLVTTTISYEEAHKRNLPSFCPGTSCASTVCEKQHASAAVSPKKRDPIAVHTWLLLSRTPASCDCS